MPIRSAGSESMSANVEEVCIRLRPLPSSDWITHEPAFDTSIVSIKEQAAEHAGPLTIVSVRLNGVPLRHRLSDAFTVKVIPRIPLVGGYLEIRCETPSLPANPSPEPLQWPTPANPTPDHSYGLQAPDCRQQRHPK